MSDKAWEYLAAAIVALVAGSYAVFDRYCTYREKIHEKDKPKMLP